MKRYVSKVIADPETNDICFILPEDLLTEMKLTEGMYLVWEVQTDGSISFRKSDFIDTKGQ